MGGATYLDNAELLGKSILLLSNGKNPFDIDKLLEGAREVMKLNDETKTIGEAHGTGFNTGSELSAALDSNSALSASYSGVSAEGSARYSYHGVLSKSKYYAVVSLDHRSFVLTLELPHGKLAVDEGLIEEAKELPAWPSEKDGVHHPSADVCEEYLEFYQTWGAYVIRSCTCGARYQLKLESHMSSEFSKHDFEAHIKAEYDGVASVKGEAGLKKSSKHSQYKKLRKSQVRVRGGDIDKTANDPLTFGVKSIGEMVNEAGGMERAERKKLVNNLNRSLSFFNSLQIIQGDLYVYTGGEVGTVDLDIQGPPGVEVDYSVIKSSTTTRKKSKTHYVFTVPKESTESSAHVCYIRVCAPPLPIKILCETPVKTQVSWSLKCGAHVVLRQNNTSHDVEIPNIFEKANHYGHTPQ
ncbi:hypothetical protein BJX62DRAFT_244327 [Aspergillus germanicus]